MSAVATKVLDKAVGTIETAYPGARVRRRRNTASVPLYGPGDSLPMFSCSIGEPESVEVLTGGPDATVAVKYPMYVAYLVSQASITNTADDTPDVREKREALRQLFHLWEPAGLEELNTVEAGAKAPFAPGEAGNAVIASVMTFTVECLESRN